MKKGFTLIELLAVIVILSLIAIIAIVNVMGAFDNVRESSYESETKIIEAAAFNYVADLISRNEQIPKYVFLKELKENGFLTKKSNLKDGAVRIDDINNLNFIDVNTTSGEIVYIDPSKTVSSIIIEGNSYQEKKTTKDNLLDQENMIKAFSNIEVVDGIKAYKYVGSTNRNIEPIFLKAGTYTLVSKAKRVYGTNGTEQTQYWGFDLATSDQNYPTAIIKATLVDNVNTEGWFTSVRTFTIPSDIWINRIHEYSYSTLTAGYYYVDINSLGLYYGSYNINNYPSEEHINNVPSFLHESEIRSLSGNINIGGKSFLLPELSKVGESKDYYNMTTGQVTKNTGVVTLNGSETWYVDGEYYYTTLFGGGNNLTIPDWFVENSFHNYKDPKLTLNQYFFVSSGAGYFEFSKYKFQTVEMFKSYLNLNPVKVLYSLKTPFNQSFSIISPINYTGYIFFENDIRGNIIVNYN